VAAGERKGNIVIVSSATSVSYQADARRAPGSKPVIAVSELSIRLPRDAEGQSRELISNLSFTLEKSEVVALLGRSGAGKTTLLNCIAGFVSPSAGQVIFALDRDRDQLPFAYMFQEDRLLPWRTAAANVELSLERLGCPRRLRRSMARQALAGVGLGEAADKYPWQLSGGMKARVTLVRALELAAPVLLLDEPFSKLDPAIREEMHDLLLARRRDLGFSALVVTHDVAEAVRIADRALILDSKTRRAVEVTIDRSRPDMAEVLLKDLKRLQ
jgi:NitT/TauT family transport system ATP-binding protein